MGRPKRILKPGYQIGHWTLVSEVSEGRWICRCICGTEREVLVASALRAEAPSCGCKRKRKYDPVAGTRYGKLTLVCQVRRYVWQCQCDCGQVAEINLYKVLSGHTRSCGCEYRKHHFHVGMRMHLLTLVSPISSVKWLCSCDCGTQKEINVYNVLYGDVRSCGCHNRYQVSHRTEEQRKAAGQKIRGTRRLNGLTKYMISETESLLDLCDEFDINFTSAIRCFQQGMTRQQIIQWNIDHSSKSSIEVATLQALQLAGLPAEAWNKQAYLHFHYMPDIKLSDSLFVDVDGLYWHSAIRQHDPRYHANKAMHYAAEGLRLMQFREDEVRDKLPIVVSMVKCAAGQVDKRYGARSLEVRSVPHQQAIAFFEVNHLMGAGANARAIGLFDGDHLVCCLSYRAYKDGVDVARFASLLNTQVSGGLSKLLKHLINTEKPRFVQSYVDLRYADGHSLERLGFKRVAVTLGWQWTDFELTYNRLYCRANMDERRLSEQQHAEEMGLVRIYDAGQAKYLLYPTG